jgi:AcrR family transcriptional regulator
MDRTSKRTDTKTRIRDVARTMFAARGYEAVSVRDIAEAVGVRPSAIYNHFPGKQALLNDLMNMHMERVLPAMSEALADATGAKELLSVFAMTHLAIHVDFKDDVFLAYYELRSLDDDGRTRFIEQRDQYEDMLRHVLDAGVADGSFQIGDVAVHARAILAMLTGITIWFRADGKLDRDSVFATYRQAVMQSVGCDPEAAT